MDPGLHQDTRSKDGTLIVRLGKADYLQCSLQRANFTNYMALPLLSDISSLEEQQTLLMTEIYYGLIGYEGNLFKFSDRYDPQLLHDRIMGPDHNVAKHIDISLKKVTKKLLRYGKMYSGLSNFCMIYNTPVFGRVNHRLCHEISNFLRSYRHFVSTHQASPQRNQGSLAAIDNAIQSEITDKLSLLYEIACLIHQETEERNPLFRAATDVTTCLAKDIAGSDPRFSTFLESIRNDIDSAGSYIGVSSDANRFEVCKGGCVLRIVQSKIAQYNGDKVSFQFLSRTFEIISQDYVELLNRWLLEGDIHDPFQEFLIRKNDLPSNIFYSNMERYWEELYVLKIDGLIDAFTSKDIQTELLSTGKFLNIFKQSIDKASLEKLSETLCVPAPEPILSLYSKDLAFKINQFYTRANNALLRMFFKGYYFDDVLYALHRTYLLDDSFGVDCFLEASFHDLNKGRRSGSILSTTSAFNAHFMKGLDYESSQGKMLSLLKMFLTIRVDDNSFYDLAEEIINIKSFDTEEAMKENENASSAIRKFVAQSLQRAPIGSRGARSATDSAGTEGSAHSNPEPIIEGLDIEVDLPFPLNLVIGESFIFEYQLIFRLQMIFKFTSKLLDNSWKDISFSSVWNYKGHSRPTRKLIVRCRALLFRMKNLSVELQSYINFSVIDANFSSLRHTSKEFKRAAEASVINDRRSPTGLGNGAVYTPDNSKSPSLHRKDLDSKWSSQNESSFFMKQTFAGNDIFDEKILGSSHRHATKVETMEKYTDVGELNNQIGKYLNNILRDSMVTNGPLLQLLKGLLNTVHSFAFTVTRLKKTLISMNADLLQEYKASYPDKFDKIDSNESSIDSRAAGLNQVVTSYWTRFNDGLAEISGELSPLSGENPSFLMLQQIFARI